MEEGVREVIRVVVVGRPGRDHEVNTFGIVPALHVGLHRGRSHRDLHADSRPLVEEPVEECGAARAERRWDGCCQTNGDSVERTVYEFLYVLAVDSGAPLSRIVPEN